MTAPVGTAARSRAGSRVATADVRLRRVLLLCLSAPLLSQPASAQSSVSVGLDYWSDYFWRGFSFYGDADAPRGVLFPWVGASWRKLSFTVVGEIPQSMLGGSPNSTEEAWIGVDFILAGSTALFDDRLRVGGRVAYFLYPNSPNVNPDGARNDFVDVGLWLQADTLPLKPRLEYSHYLRIDDRGGQQVALKDVYLRLSLRKEFEPFEHLGVSLGGSVAYFWYPSSEYWNSPAVGGNGDDYQGLSDVVATVGATTDYWSRFRPYLTLNGAYVPDRDFYRVWGEDQRWHAWVTVGLSYAWPLEDPPPVP